MDDQKRDRIKWNKKYTEQGLDSLNTAPSEWLDDHQDLLVEQEKGRVLDVACGNGRNSFYLANLGFEVDAVDLSDVAIAWLNQQILKRDVSIKPQVRDLEEERLLEETYQVIVCFNYLQRSLFSAMKESLVPGGLLFFETVYLDDIEVLGNGMNPNFALGYNELLRAFSELRILEYRERILFSQSLKKKKALASLIARKI